MYLIASLSDSIFESLLPGGFRNGSRSLSCVEQFISYNTQKPIQSVQSCAVQYSIVQCTSVQFCTCSNDLFISFILARSLSQADLLYCSLFPSSSKRFAPVLVSLSFLIPLEVNMVQMFPGTMRHLPGWHPLYEDILGVLWVTRRWWRWVENGVRDVYSWAGVLHLE